MVFAERAETLPGAPEPLLMAVEENVGVLGSFMDDALTWAADRLGEKSDFHVPSPPFSSSLRSCSLLCDLHWLHIKKESLNLNSSKSAYALKI